MVGGMKSTIDTLKRYFNESALVQVGGELTLKTNVLTFKFEEPYLYFTYIIKDKYVEELINMDIIQFRNNVAYVKCEKGTYSFYFYKENNVES